MVFRKFLLAVMTLALVSLAGFADAASYVVTAKDTSEVIVQKTGVPWSILKKSNPGLKKDSLSPGMTLVVPTAYRVKPGDTFYSLGRRWKISPSQLMAWNFISSPQQLVAGSILYIPPQGIKSDFFWPEPVIPQGPEGLLKMAQFPVRTGDFYSVCDGTVLYKGNYAGLGPVILIENEKKLVFAFGNFRQSEVKYGENVKKGQKLGTLSSQMGLIFFVSQEGKPLDPFQGGSW
ncbi:MAG: LysM peptidoglycan-binding domain-containing protein [Spirochaetales bacterium]|nr:LysM peptidoglycan-binding domain-containing protein [Spirochaetales bacterium]